MKKNTITENSLQDAIANVEYAIMGKKTTICLITLNNGFEVVGQSACVDSANFKKELGEKYAYENAFNKLWELEGYKLQCDLYNF